MRTVARAALFLLLSLPLTGWSSDDPIMSAIAARERPVADRSQDPRRKPEEMLRFLEVAPGQHVLDFFAGPGYYSELLARVVGPAGSVLIYNDPLYAQAAHHDLMVRLARKRLPNARVIGGPANYLKLAPASLDRVLFVLVYHDIYWKPRDAPEPLGDAQKVLANLRTALKPGGLVVVIDHVASDSSREHAISIAGRTHRIAPSIVREDFARAGFEFVRESTVLRNETDDHTRSVFDHTVRNRTDQFVYKFRRP